MNIGRSLEEQICRDYRTLPPHATVGDALRSLAGIDEESRTLDAVAVVDEDGVYHGVWTSPSLLHALMLETSGATEWSATPSDKEVFDLVAHFAERSLGSLECQDITVPLADLQWNSLLRAVLENDQELVPVVDGERLVGFATATSLFAEAARAVLTPEHEGIRKDSER